MPETDDELYQQPGVVDGLPVFRERLLERLTFPLSWAANRHLGFENWRRAARAKVLECLLPPPPFTAFAPRVVGERDMGEYVSRKITLNITADSRVLAYLLVPKGTGPFPAALLLHDHGARFDIGKEKMVIPWGVDEERLASAHDWVERLYGGRFVGDALARRGYVCLATDALNWSDRGGAGYAGQQALALNMLALGTSLAGRIAHEDLSAARFLCAQPEVDPRRVAAVGLSMGSFRSWQVAALTDDIAAGIAACCMTTLAARTSPGNNSTRGQSAFTMTHPGLTNWLDYADVASIACPKPMLFYNGLQDGLFPVPAVEEAYARMREVWESQGVGDRLETRLWDVAHVFDVPMQEAAFDWLDACLKAPGPTTI